MAIDQDREEEGEGWDDPESAGSFTGPDPERPYAGETLGGASAAICAGFAPEPLRFLLHQPGLRLLANFGVVVALLAFGAFAAGQALHAPGGGLWPGLRSFLLYGVGIVLGLVALIDLALLVAAHRASALYFKNALLTPGVVVSTKPLAIVVLAPLGNGAGSVYHGLERLDLRTLPFHDHAPGTRVPCVSAFFPAEGLDRWLCFTPEPISWGTGRRDLIERCFPRLGTEDFDRLDACLARGLAPRDDDELILLDEFDEPFANVSIREEKKKYAAKPQ